MPNRKPHVLNLSAAALMLKVRQTGNLSATGFPPIPADFRIWAAAGGPAFMWVDPAGNAVGGWEENSWDGGARCVVYRCMNISSGGTPLVQRHVARDFCPKCLAWSDTDRDTTVCRACQVLNCKHMTANWVGDALVCNDCGQDVTPPGITDVATCTDPGCHGECRTPAHMDQTEE